MRFDHDLSGLDLVITGIVILLFLTAAYIVADTIYILLGLTLNHQLAFGSSVEVKAFGVALILVGLAVAGDVFRVRRPLDVWVSTSVSIRKLLSRRPIGEKAGRTEQFVPEGPYVYVRNPMYFGVVSTVLGLGFAEGSGMLLLWGVTLTCGYWFLLIPFEERELRALFGESFENYRRQVPKLFPYGRRFRDPRTTGE